MAVSFSFAFGAGCCGLVALLWGEAECSGSRFSAVVVVGADIKVSGTDSSVGSALNGIISVNEQAYLSITLRLC